MNGYFNIMKSAGMSSAAVVGALKRLTGEKRVGHAGTLDPEAAGVLPVMTGKATRLFDYLVDKEKEYVAVIAFGASTDTQDATGRTLETGENYPSLELAREKAKALTGTIRQVPSMYSAIKVGGKPLYQRARQGETVSVPERTVRIDRIDVMREMPDHGMELRVHCGRGTYIRTLCHDLGVLCGCPAHMRSLLRTQSGFFTIDHAITLEEARKLQAAGELAGRLIAPDVPLQHLARVDAPERYAKQVAAGAKLPLGEASGLAEGQVGRLYLNDSFWGIVERKEETLVWKAQIAPENEVIS
jgi:tRNA pseudouridine55 synthase